MTNDWTVEQMGANAHMVRFHDVRDGWRQYVMLSADRHHDNAMTDQKLERLHLERALERNAPILDFGDLHDAMQSKADRRQSKDALRPEYIGDDYSDRLVNRAADFYKPYAENWALMGKGNHETSALRHLETDLTYRTARELRLHTGNDWPYAANYAGWVFLRFHIQKTVTQTLKLKFHHGSGGGGPVTKGVIQTNRRAVYLPDADIVVTGHIHEGWVVPITRERITQNGNTYRDVAWHVSVPTYKEEYDASGGYHVEGGRPPKPLGCAWLVLEFQAGRIVPRVELDLS